MSDVKTDTAPPPSATDAPPAEGAEGARAKQTSFDFSKLQEHPIVKQIGYYIAKSGKYVDMAMPYVIMAKEKTLEIWKKMEPYHPEYLSTIGIGLVMIFFGGTFMTLIAAVEAYRISCWEDSKKQLLILKQNFEKAWADSRADDAVDDNNDGIADVEQITKEELLKRKALILLKSIEPMQVYNAVGCLYIGFLAVMATLKVKFAQAITLGAALGEIIFNAVNPYAGPILKKALPEEYQKWGPVIISYFSKSTGISVAWTLQRIISSFHSAIRGTEILAFGLQGWFLTMNIWQGDVDQSLGQFAKLYGLGIALTGVWYQVSRGFFLPFPLNIVLLPFTIVEWFLIYLANS